MLLRSASTPMLGSFISVSNLKESPVERDFVHSQIRRTGSLTVTALFPGRAPPPPVTADPSGMLSQEQLETNVTLTGRLLDGVAVEEAAEDAEEEGIGFGLVKAVSLDCGIGLGVALEKGNENSVGSGIGGGGGSGYGEGYGGGGNGGMDEYYGRMIESDPGNPLLLSNYARFLMEVWEDLDKSEEYCGRAILADPNDGNVLSMYGDLIWRSHKDAARADTYFSQAVQAAPDDCYVLASYAHFLWEAEEDEEEDKVEEEARTRRTPY